VIHPDATVEIVVGQQDQLGVDANDWDT
jgi:hypothetical protein